jgi:PII-like signaling protein
MVIKFKRIRWFGASSVIHTASLVELSTDLPVLIEVVDEETHVDRLLLSSTRW